MKKPDDITYLKYLDWKKDDFNINEVLCALVERNQDFRKTELFRTKKSKDINRLVDMGNVMVENHYDSLLTVEGNVDKDTLPGLEDILKRSYEYTSKQMVKELRKGGMQIRR